MFENKLAVELYKASLLKTPIWIEDESQRIGLINIPHVFWQMMRARPLYFVMIPF
jgi:tRNA 2-selenouridine synthase